MNNNVKQPYLSIIVPIYNTEQYLKKCIESILGQTYINFELILVDDGSTDNCLSICNHYAEHDSRIQVIHQKNGGVTSARKAGLDIACGEYVSFIDSDDWMEPDYYSAFMDNCKGIQPDIILASGYKIEEVRDKRKQIQKVHSQLKNGIYHQKAIKKILERESVFPVLWLKLFKRDLIEKNISLIDNRVCLAEDNLCFYACMLDADCILVHSNYKYHYVQHESSAIHRHSGKNIENIGYFTNNLKKIRDIKNAEFLDLQWNQMILEVLLKVILKEFKRKKLFLNLKESKGFRRKFGDLRLFKLLIGNEYKAAINQRSKNEKMILLLYSFQCYQLLNCYMKLGNYKKKVS